MQNALSTAPLHQSATQPLNSQPRTEPIRLDPPRTGSLLDAYKAALAELDARPAQYTPRAHATDTGARLLLQHSIEAADAAARIARQEQQDAAAAAAKAAADLLRMQQQHPLYYTHHRANLLAYWDAHGQAPTAPDRALDGFTAYIQRHATADDDDIREMADKLEKATRHTLWEKLGRYATRYLDPLNPTEQTAKNLRRTLRSAIRQFNEQAAHILRLVTKNGQKYVSDHTRRARRHQLTAQERWLSTTYIIDKTKEHPTEKDRIPLALCTRTAHHRFSELYTLVRGQEKHFSGRGYIPLFITLTSPAEYHPAPANGADKWDGSSVRDSHEWFTQGWQLVRSTLAKAKIRLDGFRVTEPHSDGAEHWHLLCYIPDEQLNTVKSVITNFFAHSEHAVQFKEDFTGPARPGRATAAGYMMKYLIKSINAGAAENTSAANDSNFSNEAAAADAWRSTWGIRAFQFFGVLFGKQTLWRELWRLEEQPTEPAARALWRAARGGRADRFIATIADDKPELATIHETTAEWTPPDENGEVAEYHKKGRVVGVSINQKAYITHTTAYRLETDYSDLNEDFPTGYSYSVSTQGGNPAAPMTWTELTKIADEQARRRQDEPPRTKIYD